MLDNFIVIHVDAQKFNPQTATYNLLKFAKFFERLICEQHFALVASFYAVMNDRRAP